jgi:hypothetical protein
VRRVERLHRHRRLELAHLLERARRHELVPPAPQGEERQAQRRELAPRVDGEDLPQARRHRLRLHELRDLEERVDDFVRDLGADEDAADRGARRMPEERGADERFEPRRHEGRGLRAKVATRTSARRPGGRRDAMRIASGPE